MVWLRFCVEVAPFSASRSLMTSSSVKKRIACEGTLGVLTAFIGWVRGSPLSLPKRRTPAGFSRIRPPSAARCPGPGSAGAGCSRRLSPLFAGEG